MGWRDAPLVEGQEATPAATPEATEAPQYNIYQRRMGLGRRHSDDPVGQLAEGVSNIPEGLGRGVTDLATSAGLPPGGAAAAGTAANLIGQVIPMALGGPTGELAGARVAAPLMKRTAQGLMQSAMKIPSAAAKTSRIGAGLSKGERAINTMLEGGFNVSHEGLAKMRAEIDKLEGQVKDAIERNKDKVVDVSSVKKGMKEVFDRFKNRISKSERTEDIVSAIKEFTNHPWVKGLQDGKLPVGRAQELKKGAYQSLGERAYVPGGVPEAEKEAYKGLAHQLRTGIEKQVPEVASPNARIAELVNAGNIATKPTLMAANRNPAGLGWLAHSPATFAAFELERSPAVKSAIANVLYRHAPQMGTVGRNAGLALGLVPPYLNMPDDETQPPPQGNSR